MAAKQSAVENNRFKMATSHLRSNKRFQVCKLKDEKVLNPPQTPTASSCCKAVAKARSARWARMPEIRPRRIDAVILTTNVPNGKVSPKRRATKPDHQKRHKVPIAPPTKTSAAASTCIKRLTSQPAKP